uniref:Transposase n=1 Tax=Macrostomum lignano TaxID=282301 RepID=A0A1I8GWB8_9PLAT
MFDSQGDRSSMVLFYQLRGLKRHLVGTYDPSTAIANWTEDLWFARKRNELVNV